MRSFSIAFTLKSAAVKDVELEDSEVDGPRQRELGHELRDELHPEPDVPRLVALVVRHQARRAPARSRASRTRWNATER